MSFLSLLVSGRRNSGEVVNDAAAVDVAVLLFFLGSYNSAEIGRIRPTGVVNNAWVCYQTTQYESKCFAGCRAVTATTTTTPTTATATTTTTGLWAHRRAPPPPFLITRGSTFLHYASSSSSSTSPSASASASSSSSSVNTKFAFR